MHQGVEVNTVPIRCGKSQNVDEMALTLILILSCVPLSLSVQDVPTLNRTVFKYYV